MKEVVLYFIKTNYVNTIISISSVLGWGVTCFTNKLVFNSNIHSILFNKTFGSYFNNFQLGFRNMYCYILKLKGFGLKILKHYKGLILKLGYSHKILFLFTQSVSLIYTNRQALKIKGRLIDKVKMVLFDIFKLKKSSPYYIRFWRLKGEKKFIKASKKKTKK